MMKTERILSLKLTAPDGGAEDASREMDEEDDELMIAQ